MHLEGARDIMPGAAVSAACGLPSPRTDPETGVGASPHAKTSGTKRPAAVVTPSPDPKRPKGSHRPPQPLLFWLFSRPQLGDASVPNVHHPAVLRVPMRMLSAPLTKIVVERRPATERRLNRES